MRRRSIIKPSMLLQVAALLLQLQLGETREEKLQQLLPQNEGYYCYTDGHLHTRSPCRFFAIVMDAGSTGTRLQLYRFVHSTQPGGLPFHAEEETFHETKPGLSGYVGRPEEAAESVERLIEKAKLVVPEELWKRTPLTLKATAGLRLLPGDAAQRILEAVNTRLLSSGFACLSPECAAILDGKEEGVHSWFTLNLLLRSFYEDASGNEVAPSPGRSAAAFDLGGGSTQVTFWPLSEARLQKEERHDIDFFETHMHLYTQSYLGAGLQSARLDILRGGEKGEEEEEGGRELKSPCFPADFRLDKWEQAQREWRLSGSPDYSLEACEQSVRAFVKRAKIGNLKDLLPASTPLFLFSYFFDRARQAGLVGEEETSREITVAEWRRAAERACSSPASTLSSASAPHWRAWQCLDLVYIHQLLREGYGFEEERRIVPVTSINGMGVSWALGLAYSLVDEFHRKLALEDIDDDVIRDQRSTPKVNTTGVEIVDSLLTVLSQKTTDVLQYFNLVS